MTKKCMSVAIIICLSLMFVSAAEKHDTTSGAKIVTSKQTISPALPKQSMIKPIKSSNWSKIKDLFM
jgi:hypothetical protein